VGLRAVSSAITTSELGEDHGPRRVAVETLDLAVLQLEHVAARRVHPPAGWFEHSARRPERAVVGALQRELDDDDVSVHVEPVQLAVHVGERPPVVLHRDDAIRTAVGDTDRAGETTLPGESGQDTVVRCASPSIESVLDSIKLVRTLRRSRRVARVCAATFIVVAVPLAATGILAPVLAAVAATAGLVLVAAVAWSIVLMHTSAPAED